MLNINSEFFIKESQTLKVLENITNYCSKCYKELTNKDELYLNTNNYEYICQECACCLSEELQTKQECVLECEESSLFS